MQQFILSIGSSRYTLTAEQIAKYPGSLLAELAVSQRADGSDSDSEAAGPPVTIKLDDLPSNPFTEWPESGAIVVALIRDGRIPAAALTVALKGDYGNDAAALAANALMAKLGGLLDYLNLPGPVCNWLPPLDSLQLQQASVLSFCQLAFAWDAAETMMSYQPFSEAGSSSTQSNFAAFIITMPKEGTPQLSVRVVPNPPADVVSWANSTQRLLYYDSLCSIKELSESCNLCMKAELLERADNGKSVKRARLSPGSVVDALKAAQAVDTSKMGRCVVQALSAATKGTGAKAGCVCIRHGKVKDSVKPWAPFWIIKW